MIQIEDPSIALREEEEEDEDDEEDEDEDEDEDEGTKRGQKRAKVCGAHIHPGATLIPQ